MSAPARRPPSPPRRRRGGPPALGLVLAAVLGAHLWVLDAWSLPTKVPDVAAAQAQTPAAPPRVTALPATAVPMPVPAPSPMAAPTPPAPPRPRPPAKVATPAVPRVEAPVPVSGTVMEAEAEPATTAAAAHDTAPAEPRLLALAATTSSPARGALTAPPPARLLYRLHKGPLTGTGRIDWQRDADTYRMRLEARVPVFGQIFLETSDGRLDASGLLPLRHTERRLKRSERALSFVRDQGTPRILFSAREGQEPLTPGAQDRLSWIAQLATRMAAPPSGEWRPGQRLDMDVASTGGDVQRWVFTLLGKDGAGLWQLRREPDSPHDTRAEVWIDARQHHWPVRIRLSEPGGDPLELTLESLHPGGS